MLRDTVSLVALAPTQTLNKTINACSEKDCARVMEIPLSPKIATFFQQSRPGVWFSVKKVRLLHYMTAILLYVGEM